MCYLPVAGGCPSGWTQKENYSTTQRNSCAMGVACGPGPALWRICSTGSHFRTNKGVEICQYLKWYQYPHSGRGGSGGCNGRQEWANCYASQTETGCVKTE